VDIAREGSLPYPMRALCTANYLSIRNFAPDRLPLGRAGIAAAGAEADANALETNTFAAYPDMDASPTNAWVIRHGTEGEWRWLADYAFQTTSADPEEIPPAAGPAGGSSGARGVSAHRSGWTALGRVGSPLRVAGVRRADGGRANRDRFLMFAGRRLDAPLPLADAPRVTGSTYHPLWRQISGVWVAEHANPGTMAACLEAPWNTPHSTTAGYLDLGARLGRTVADFLRFRESQGPARGVPTDQIPR
jgi:hypothetical protein